jgi:hypothetical protein
MCEPPSNPTSTLSPAAPFLLRRSALACPIPAHGARISRSAPACLRRDGTQSTSMHGVHIEQAELLLGATAAPAVRFRSAGAGPLQAAGWCSHAVGSGATSSSPLTMIKGSSSISFWWTFLASPRLHLDGTFDRSRARRLSLCVFVLLERGRDGGCWSWVVIECPCDSVVSGSVLMNNNTNGTLRVLPATL